MSLLKMLKVNDRQKMLWCIRRFFAVFCLGVSAENSAKRPKNPCVFCFLNTMKAWKGPICFLSRWLTLVRPAKISQVKKKLIGAKDCQSRLCFFFWRVCVKYWVFETLESTTNIKFQNKFPKKFEDWIELGGGVGAFKGTLAETFEQKNAGNFYFVV